MYYERLRKEYVPRFLSPVGFLYAINKMTFDFLNSESIFHSKLFSEKYEAQTRKNLSAISEGPGAFKKANWDLLHGNGTKDLIKIKSVGWKPLLKQNFDYRHMSELLDKIPFIISNRRDLHRKSKKAIGVNEINAPAVNSFRKTSRKLLLIGPKCFYRAGAEGALARYIVDSVKKDGILSRNLKESLTRYVKRLGFPENLVGEIRDISQREVDYTKRPYSKRHWNLPYGENDDIIQRSSDMEVEEIIETLSIYKVIGTKSIRRYDQLTYNAAIRKIGPWKLVTDITGLKYERPDTSMTKEELVEALNDLKKKNIMSPSSLDYKSLRSASTRHFGTWNKAKEHVGMETSRERKRLPQYDMIKNFLEGNPSKIHEIQNHLKKKKMPTKNEYVRSVVKEIGAANMGSRSPRTESLVYYLSGDQKKARERVNKEWELTYLKRPLRLLKETRPISYLLQNNISRNVIKYLQDSGRIYVVSLPTKNVSSTLRSKYRIVDGPRYAVTRDGLDEFAETVVGKLLSSMDVGTAKFTYQRLEKQVSDWPEPVKKSVLETYKKIVDLAKAEA